MQFRRSRIPLAAAALCLVATQAGAQTGNVVTITGKGTAPLGVGGFGDVPLARSPLQASVFGSEALADAGVGSLADLTRLDASVSDAYNTEGYWSYFTVRGFVLDNRSNFRRDGLPINAETALALGNKDRIEVLKGTSGIQAGTSAPGGLVNLVVKRPTGTVRQAGLAWRENGTLAGTLDIGDRFGTDGRLGLRINAAWTTLRPQTRAADGRASLFALASDWQVTPDARIEFEFERSRHSQPSTPGFSLLGDRVPDASSIDPRTSLNNQPWSLPVALDGDTASLRWVQRLSVDWRASAHAATQQLHSDDRVAFPFGCYDAVADIYYADRYCPDGSFDLYDFRSEGERRRVDAIELRLDGSLRTGGLTHVLTAGVLQTRGKDRFNRQAFNYSGTGNIAATLFTPAAPDLTDENTQRDERSTEAYLRDHLRLGAGWEAWVGLRHTRLERSSIRTDGSRQTSYGQSFTTPWLALSRSLGPSTIAYASWGQGVETEVVPNRSRYVNRGEALPALKSRQIEVGVKHDDGRMNWAVTAFEVERPLAQDFCRGPDTTECTRRIDGAARHRGLEGSWGLREGAWTTQWSGLLLDATRVGATDAASNGLRPTNVPRYSVRGQVGHDLSALPGLTLLGYWTREGEREVLPDNTLKIPAWDRIDLAARYAHKVNGRPLTWRLAVENITNQRAWRESPYQFSHSYLFPLAPRTWRGSVDLSF